MNRKKLLISLAMTMLSMAGLAADNLQRQSLGHGRIQCQRHYTLSQLFREDVYRHH